MPWQSTTAPPSLSPALRSLLIAWINRSTDLLSSPPLSPLADDEAHIYHHGDASSTSSSMSLRPKGRGLAIGTTHKEKKKNHKNPNQI